jgi:hypothetical protein
MPAAEGELRKKLLHLSFKQLTKSNRGFDHIDPRFLNVVLLLGLARMDRQPQMMAAQGRY